jgi:hypothetical protein
MEDTDAETVAGAKKWMQRKESEFKGMITSTFNNSKKQRFIEIEQEFRHRIKVGHTKKAWDTMKDGIRQTKQREEGQPLVEGSEGTKAASPWESANNWKAFWSTLGEYDREQTWTMTYGVHVEECERDFERLVYEEEEEAVKQVYEEAEQLEEQAEYSLDIVAARTRTLPLKTNRDS